MHATATPSSATAPRAYEDLPGPRGLPLVGNALQIEPGRFHQQLEAWAGEYGPYFRLQLKERRAIVVSEHETIAAVLRDRPAGFTRSRKQAAIWAEMGLPEGLFMAEGPAWERQRRMVMSAFDPAHIRRYLPAMREVAGRLALRWQAAAREGRALDLQAELMRYTVDTIAGLAFGEEVDTLGGGDDVIQRHLNAIFPTLYRRVLAPVAMWRLHKSRADRELDAAIAEVKAAVAGFIARSRQRMAAEPQRREQPSNLLEAMIAAGDQAGSGIDDEQVAGNVLTMLLAGEDTTANTLAWMLHLLWRHPPALQRAVDEVRQVLGDTLLEAITPEQLGALDYLEACTHETMRLKPVAPMLPLQAAMDTRIGPVDVPAGVVVLLLMRHDGLDEARFSEPRRFMPERWLQAQAQGAKRVAMPFGAGPRICPGRYLALLEIKLALAMLLSRFEITAVDAAGEAGEAAELLAFTMQPVGLMMRLREGMA
ncbi:cytochrome P450 [Pelomonas sp. KK5]|uniref:cytochrome P450 n=1 Tax=Pelomonas sp. KK5 TaxID=1855730 RepID=UPI00097BEECF|nr:cytochrome P450 [Pelomonas sp. KK5]